MHDLDWDWQIPMYQSAPARMWGNDAELLARNSVLRVAAVFAPNSGGIWCFNTWLTAGFNSFWFFTAHQPNTCAAQIQNSFIVNTDLHWAQTDVKCCVLLTESQSENSQTLDNFTYWISLSLSPKTNLTTSFALSRKFGLAEQKLVLK